MKRVLRSRRLWGGAAVALLIASAQPTAANSSSRARVFSMVRTRARVVALTFDDGPDPDLTPRVIEMLRRYGARATFFVTGSNAMVRPEEIANELTVGEVGNHTWSHADLSKISSRTAQAQLRETDVVLSGLLGERPRYFRPPFGHLPHSALAAIGRAGHEVVRWNLAIDHFRLTRPHVERDIVARVRPGSIILAHDACPPYDARAWCLRVRSSALDVLDRVLALLSARGWRVVTVSELRAFHGR